jgi:hypothetical protein
MVQVRELGCLGCQQGGRLDFLITLLSCTECVATRWQALQGFGRGFLPDLFLTCPKLLKTFCCCGEG